MTKEQLYNNFARYYDRIYEKLDHEKEVEFVKWAVCKHKIVKVMNSLILHVELEDMPFS
jgi:hypothetical protein